MSQHTFVFPSAKPSIGVPCATAWIEKGYNVCVGVDRWDDLAPYRDVLSSDHADVMVLQFEPPFPGYYRVINDLVKRAFYGGAEVVTVGGDDQTPPKEGAKAIADIYFERFKNGEGVMQACGDMQGEIINGVHNAARICGSPTFGQAWMWDSYREGPFHSGYRSYYGDEDLWNFAKQQGKLWLNFGVTIDHEHWAFGRRTRQDYHVVAEKNWEADKALFERRKAQGFPA